MKLLSVNIGREEQIQDGQVPDTTGIFKAPVSGPVLLGLLGVAGDTVVDRKNHGGPDQAVYVYGGEDYAWWADAWGRELEPGTFGENLTIAGLSSAGCAVGDRLHVGDALLEVTAPRIPCSTLSARMNDPGFVKRFRQAERPGLYCRVLREGYVKAGDPVRLEPAAGETLGIREMFRGHYDRDLDEAALRRQLAAPISLRARAALEARLSRLLDGKVD